MWHLIVVSSHSPIQRLHWTLPPNQPYLPMSLSMSSTCWLTLIFPPLQIVPWCLVLWEWRPALERCRTKTMGDSNCRWTAMDSEQETALNGRWSHSIAGPNMPFCFLHLGKVSKKKWSKKSCDLPNLPRPIGGWDQVQNMFLVSKNGPMWSLKKTFFCSSKTVWILCFFSCT